MRRAKTFDASISADASWDAGIFGHIPLPGSFAVRINNDGFRGYLGPPGITLPIPPGLFYGTITYNWGDAAPVTHPYQDMSGKPVFPFGYRAGKRGRAAGATSFTVPAGAPTESLTLHGADGAPDVTLLGPDGAPVAFDNKGRRRRARHGGAERREQATYVGILHPRVGRWTVQEAPGSKSAIASIEYSAGVSPPKVSARVTGRGSSARCATARPSPTTSRSRSRSGSATSSTGSGP